MLSSCKKNEDDSKPSISIFSPVDYASYSLGDTMNVVGRVSHNSEIKYIKLVVKNDLDIAIIWNVNTTNTGTPLGRDVGDPETGKAPEISQAQMKLLLSSFSNIDAPSSRVDADGIPRSLRDGNGIPSEPYKGELKNVRIYCWDDAPVSLDNIKSDFGNNTPSAIIYINGGAEWGTDDGGSDGGLYQTLLDAANDDIGSAPTFLCYNESGRVDPDGNYTGGVQWFAQTHAASC